MQKFQKYILHPVTALLFAFGVARFVGHFSLLEFAYADVISFVFVFLGYTLLSRRYELVLSYIFFAIALFVLYKAVTIPGRTQIMPQEPEQIAVKKLKSMAALVHYIDLENGELPPSLSDISALISNSPGFNFDYCLNNDCQDKISGFNQSSLKQSRFVVRADYKEQNSDFKTWFADDQLKIYKINQTGDIQLVLK